MAGGYYGDGSARCCCNCGNCIMMSIHLIDHCGHTTPRQDLYAQQLIIKKAIVPAEPKKDMKKISNFAKKLLDPDTRAFIKAGILDSELELTEDGIDLLHAMFFLKYKKELLVEAKKLAKDKGKKNQNEDED